MNSTVMCRMVILPLQYSTKMHGIEFMSLGRKLERNAAGQPRPEKNKAASGMYVERGKRNVCKKKSTHKKKKKTQY